MNRRILFDRRSNPEGPPFHKRLKHILLSCSAVRLGMAVLLVLIALPLTAASPKKVTVRFESGNPDPVIEDLLYLSLGVELSNYGYSSVPDGSDSPKTPYLLVADYEFRETEAEIILTLARTGLSGGELSTVDFVLPVDTTFDTVLAGNVELLLSSAELDESTDESAAPEIGGLFRTELITRESLLRTDKTVRLETMLGAGVVPILGDFSDYSHLGVYSVVQAGVLFLKPGWSLSAGGRFSFTPVLLADGVAGGPVYLSTVGTNIQFGLGAAQKFKLAGAVSGGAAVISIAGGGESISKTVPYIDAGVLAAFPLGRSWFLGGDVRFLAVFNPEIPIFGVTSAVVVSMEY